MAQKVTYDPSVMHEFAAKLYGRAASLVASYTLLGVLLGAGAGVALSGIRTVNPPVVAIVALVGALIGYSIGSEKAFWLRLQAQTALCQMQIEFNTRAAAAAARVSVSAA